MQFVDTMIFPMVLIGGGIVRPHLWSLQPTEGNGRESTEGSTHKGPRSSNLDYSITASIHEGLASPWIDLA